MLIIEDRESTDMDEGEPPTSGAATRTDNFILVESNDSHRAPQSAVAHRFGIT